MPPIFFNPPPPPGASAEVLANYRRLLDENDRETWIMFLATVVPMALGAVVILSIAAANFPLACL